MRVTLWIVAASVCCLVATAAAHGQAVNHIEFFVGADPGHGFGTPVRIEPGEDVAATFSIDMGLLPAGVHRVFVRARDDRGRWSTTASYAFFNLGEPEVAEGRRVVYAEYFVGEDPGHGNAIAIPLEAGGEVEASFLVDTGSLPVGVHRVFVRARDDRGRWSTTASYAFFNVGSPSGATATVTRIEYFFNDDDPGPGRARSVPFSSAGDVRLTFLANLSGLPDGRHALYVRAQDSEGKWSHVAGPHEFVVGRALLSVYPRRAGNGGATMLTLGGLGFYPGTTSTASLEGPATIQALSVRVAPSQSEATATFDVEGMPVGTYDVVLSDPDGFRRVLPQSFVIEDPTPPELWAEIVGPPTVALNRPVPFSVTYGNRGNTDAYGVSVFMTLPTSVEWTLLTRVDTGDEDLLPPGEDRIAVIDDSLSVVIFPFWIPVLPGNTSYTLDFVLTFREGGNASITAFVMPPMVEMNLGSLVAFKTSASSDCGSSSQCGAAKLSLALNIAGNMLQDFPWAGCITGIADQMVHMIAGNMGANCGGSEAPRAFPVMTEEAFWIQSGRNVAECALDFLLYAKMVKRFLVAINRIKNDAAVPGLVEAFGRVNEACGDPPGGSGGVRVVNAWDPNEKYGAQGRGLGRYLSGISPLPYAIAFENLDTATAPAQEVFIEDVLDVTVLDLETFSFGAVSWSGEQRIVPPPGLQSYTEDVEVDLGPEGDLIVRVRMHLDRSTGIARWSFHSIDPTTGQLPINPFSGFLPPNLTPPEGDGQVLFSVTPRQGLPSGTLIENRAEIVFDLNEPIITDMWSNRLDFGRPTSSVVGLAAVQSDSVFLVRWNGSDDVSGIESYTIRVSFEGGPYKYWILNTTATEALFRPDTVGTYAFYSIARDVAGNVELPKSAPDVTTAVISTIAEYDADLPLTFALFQNYPNPFRTSTVFRYDLPQPSEVRIVVYDMMGRRVLQAHNAYKEAGRHAFEWTPDGLAAGTYLLRFEAGTFSQTTRLVKMH
jgi:hypothetical protein